MHAPWQHPTTTTCRIPPWQPNCSSVLGRWRGEREGPQLGAPAPAPAPAATAIQVAMGAGRWINRSTYLPRPDFPLSHTDPYLSAPPQRVEPCERVAEALAQGTVAYAACGRAVVLCGAEADREREREREATDGGKHAQGRWRVRAARCRVPEAAGAFGFVVSCRRVEKGVWLLLVVVLCEQSNSIRGLTYYLSSFFPRCSASCATASSSSASAPPSVACHQPLHPHTYTHILQLHTTSPCRTSSLPRVTTPSPRPLRASTWRLSSR